MLIATTENDTMMFCPYCGQQDNAPWGEEEEVSLGEDVLWCCKACDKHYRAVLRAEICIKTTKVDQSSF